VVGDVVVVAVDIVVDVATAAGVVVFVAAAVDGVSVAVVVEFVAVGDGVVDDGHFPQVDKNVGQRPESDAGPPKVHCSRLRPQ